MAEVVLKSPRNHQQKKTLHNTCRVLLCLIKDQKAKGEEKPEEDLWGNVSLLRGWQQHLISHVVIFIMAKIKLYIHIAREFHEEDIV